VQSDSDYAPPYSETEGESTDEPEFEESDSDDEEGDDVNRGAEVTHEIMEHSLTPMEIDEDDGLGWFESMSTDMVEWDAFAEQVSADRWRKRPSELGGDDFYHTWRVGVGRT